MDVEGIRGGPDPNQNLTLVLSKKVAKKKIGEDLSVLLFFPQEQDGKNKLIVPIKSKCLWRCVWMLRESGEDQTLIKI